MSSRSIHLIHIGDQKERVRALEAFLDVPESYVSLPGNLLGITDKHLEALRRLHPPVSFETPARDHFRNGQNPTAQPK